MSSIKLKHSSGNSMSIAAPATNPASDLELKLPATVGTAGQVLKNSGTAGTLEFGHALEVDQWRLHTTLSSAATFITANWERVDTDFVHIGTGMSESSGVFSFPTTGIWRVEFNMSNSHTDYARRYVGGHIYYTTDNSSYSEKVQVYNSYRDAGSSNSYASTHAVLMFDVSDVSTHKVKFYVVSDGSSSWHGSTSQNNNYVTFTRLGDT